MVIFETERLVIKSVERRDLDHFTTLLSDPSIIDPIPQAPFDENEIVVKFQENLHLKSSDLNRDKYIGGIYEKGKKELIGLCLFLTNDENVRELGYRFRTRYWGKGYGTETTKGIIEYYFNQMHVKKIAADVNTENIGSVRILEKFLIPKKEFFNNERQCTVRRYELEKQDWVL